MSNAWNEGYFTDEGYTFGYCREINPVFPPVLSRETQKVLTHRASSMMCVSVSGHKSESQQTRHAINALVVLRIHLQAPEPGQQNAYAQFVAFLALPVPTGLHFAASSLG